MPLSCRLAALLACTIATLLASCGSEDPEPPPHIGTVYVPLTLTKGAWPAADIEAVFEAPMPTGSEQLGEPWSTKHVDRVTVEDGPAPCLAVAPGSSNVRLRLALPNDTPAFDVARLTLSCERQARVSVAATRDEQALSSSELIEVDASEPRLIRDFDLAALAFEGNKPNTLHVVLKGVHGTLRLHAVTLLHRPVALHLAAPGAWPRHEALDNDFRPVHALLPAIEVSGSLPATGIPSRVAVDLGAPNAAAQGAPVTLEILDRGQTIAQRVVPLSSAWSTAALTLPASDSDERQIRCTTDSPSGAWVGVPRVVPTEAERSVSPRTALLVTVDTHRADHVGYAPDGADVATPCIDALAARGTRFLDAWSVTSITNPSHASILTGQPMTTTGVLGNLAAISERAHLIGEHFQAAGYRTFASVSARHMIPSRSGFGQGFERFDGPRTLWARDGAETVAALEAMLVDAQGDDVFVWLHLFDSHAPYRSHKEFIDAYYQGDPYLERAREIAPEAVASWDRKIRDAGYIAAQYRSEVSHVDRMLGDLLQRRRRLADGWIALTADHGESLGENGQYWNHATIYPSAVRVPLVVAGPGVPAGVTVHRAVTNLDVAETLVQMTGSVNPQRPFPGRSLLAATDTEPAPRFTIGPNGRAAGIESGGWYLVLQLEHHKFHQTTGKVRHAVELYDLTADPVATQNVCEQNRERATRMRTALIEWLNAAPTDGVLVGARVEDSTAKADVTALGYAANATSTLGSTLIDPDCRCRRCVAFRAN